MKKIGILFGQEHSFPPAFVERVNQKTGGKDIVAEFVRIDRVMQGEPCGYDVVIDRISQDVPFYRAWLKNAALTGTAVVNNPFWWSADDKFFNNALATKIGVAVPRTVLLPSNQPPPDTNEKSFRNLGYPLNWEAIFNYVGWPAFFKPFAGGGWKNVYRLHNPDEFFHAYNDTGQLVMMLQEEVKFEMYFRCYSIDQRHVRIMPYEPRHPYHLRYQTEWQGPQDIFEKVEGGGLRLKQFLGEDLNNEEFAILDPETRELRSHIHEILEGGKILLKEQIKPEMHQSVVELGTEVCDSIGCARAHVIELRSRLAELAGRSGLKIASVGTHPFSHWRHQHITKGERYQQI